MTDHLLNYMYAIHAKKTGIKDPSNGVVKFKQIGGTLLTQAATLKRKGRLTKFPVYCCM